MQPWGMCKFSMKKVVSVLGVVALPLERQPSLLGKLCVHTTMCFGCLIRSWYSFEMPVLQSMIEDARGVIGKVENGVMGLLMITG